MRIFIATIVLSIFLDFFSKILAVDYILSQINLVGDFLYLKVIKNTGIAFSIAVGPILLKILTIGLIIGITIFYIKDIEKLKSNLLNIAFGLIIGGAIANGYGRIFEGKVVDFIGIKGFSIFNLADVFITIGAGLFILFYLTKKDE